MSSCPTFLSERTSSLDLSSPAGVSADSQDGSGSTDIWCINYDMLGNLPLTPPLEKHMKMAAASKNQALIDEIKQSRAEIPWCNEVEKMISGMVFDGSKDPIIAAYRVRMLRMLQEFNDSSIPEGSTWETLKTRRLAVAERMLGKIGACSNIMNPFYCGCGFNLFIGDGVYINRDVSIYNNAPVTIGDGVLIGPGVTICTDTHDLDPDIRGKGGSYALPVRIEEECWIGANATILPGVTIGKRATVAAGALVAKDVETGSVVGGVPARFLRST